MKKVNLNSSLYVSCCYYGLKQAGLVKGIENPKHLCFGNKISELGKDFSFNAPMAGGPIFSLVYQIPGYLNADPKNLSKVMTGIKEYVETKSISYFKNEWPSETQYWELWYTEPWNNYLLNKLAHNKTRALHIIEKFFSYLADIWAAYELIHAKKIKEYPFAQRENICNELKAFDKWQEELNISYPYSDFSIIICPETRSSASSLGPEKIVVGAKYETSELINSCIHEIGVRMFGLHQLAQNIATKDIFLKDYHGLIMLIENEVCCHKPYVLPEIINDPFIKGMNLTDLYNWRIKQNVVSDIYTSFGIWYKQLKEIGLL